MTGKPHRFFRVWIAAAATAILCWMFVPTSAPDRLAFESLACTGKVSPHHITGDGSHPSPWQIHSATQSSASHQTQAFIKLNDDLEGLFQSSPHAPIDIAVILSNMHRLGARKPACATLLAWDQPDPIGLTALERQMAAFDSLVIAVPLTRGAVMEPLPAAFRRASLPIEDIKGNTNTLPVINRVSLPNLIYGQDNTLAGFQALDSEPQSNRIPLMARWDYRVVFAFPLLAAIQQLDINPSDLKVHIGEYIQLGPKGRKIPIDEFGRISADPAKLPQPFEIKAENLINGKPALLEDHPFVSPILLDERSNTEESTKHFNTMAATALIAITSKNSKPTTQNYPRLTISQEIFILLALALMLAVMSPLPNISRVFAYLTVFAACMLCQYAAVAHFHCWPPGISALATALVALIASLGRARGKAIYLLPSDGPDYSRYTGKPTDR